ncbi:translocation/assembly module TamB domain-containing protein [Rhizobium sp. CSW-27]|uniref:translocation/assembly module TamB domain-containing protein n=1 Tax=Rhizobium sp. CSW-27 TaxID=2839985 RepID=UPI001C00992F|nr:translocation/assembly module TamB domain-containing protein [Rhizobium sp. CSW-27]MBT9370747.1 translocation/assembly module TamB domain-containing protein [Rhizobium sp. CSW-27]
MTSPSRTRRGIFRIALGAVTVLLVLLLAAVLFLGFVPAGNRLAGQAISSLISSPSQTIELSAPKGLLTGRLRIESVRLSDRDGLFATAEGIAVDWSPLALLSGTFHADLIAIDRLALERPPVPPQTQQSSQTASGSRFSLPVAIDIDSLQLPDISIEPAVTGRQFELAATGALNATDERVALALTAHRKDTPNAIAKADILFAPAQNELKLEALVSEPQGGLLARLLHLPGAPAVALALDGYGPLSNWNGQLRGTVDGRPVISMDGQHMLTSEGGHRVQIEGGGQLAELMPPTLRPLFAGRTDINLGAVIGRNGRIEIRKGEFVTGAMKVAASGTFDPSGDNSLTASVTATNGAVAMEWPLQGEPLRFGLDNLNFTLTGPTASSRFNATAALRSVSAFDASFGQVRLQAESEDLNLSAWSGSIRTRLSAAQARFANPDLDRLIDGPIRLDAPIRLAPPAIGLDAATFESANISGTISGAYNLSQKTVTGNLRMSLNPDGLPEMVGDYVNGMIGFEGYVDATIGGRMSLENLVVKSSVIEGHGNVLLKDGKLEASLAGRMPDLAKLRPDAKGAIGYDIRMNGPLDALTASAQVNTAEARLSGHLFEAINLKLQGGMANGQPAGNVTATGRVDGKPIHVESEVRTADGLVSLPKLLLEAGGNRVTGALSFSADYLPAGDLQFQLPDIGLLSALAGQQVRGDLTGTLRLANADGTLSATLDAGGQTLSANGISLAAPQIALKSGDLMQARIAGRIGAATVEAAGQRVEAPLLTLTENGATTGFSLDARYAEAPLAIAGGLTRQDDGMAIALDRFTAAPAGIALSLAEPATIRLDAGRVELADLAFTTGSGRVVIDGSAGSQINIALRASDVPAAIANSVLPDLGAAGEIGGAVTIGGTPAAPVLRYSLTLSDASVAVLRQRAIAPVSLSARGRFEDGTVTIEQADLDGENGLSLSASGTIGTGAQQQIVLGVDLTSIPAALANAPQPGLAAQGTLSGRATVTGTLAAPVADLSLSLARGSTAQTRAAGLGALTGSASGHFENQTLRLNALQIGGSRGLSLSASGMLGLAGERALAVDARFSDIPANLLDLVRPDLAAEGNLSGTARIGGTLASPTASFDLQLGALSLEPTRAAGLAPMRLTATGRYGERVLTLEQARLAGQDGLSLDAGGTVSLGEAPSLDISARFEALPAALANIARPGLAASGTASGTVSARGALSSPTVAYDVTVSDIATSQSREAGLRALDLRARGSFENGVLTLGETRLSDPSGLSATAAGRIILTGPQAPALDLNAEIAALPANLANAVLPDLNAGGTVSGTISSTGSAQAPAARFDLRWRNAQTRQTLNAGLAGLTVTARGTLQAGTLTLDAAELAGPSGLSASAKGSVALSGERALDLTAALTSVPASLISGFVPSLEAGGTVSGSATIAGTLAAPALRYDLQWANGEIRRQGDAGLSGLNLKASGSFADGRLTLNQTRLSGPQGLSLTAQGSVVPVGPQGPVLDVTADIHALPASLANAFVPGLGATGRISGTVTALPGGTANGARFDLSWEEASLEKTRAAGLSSFRLSASGSYQGDRLTLQKAELGGASGLSVSASGSVGVTGERPLDVKVSGEVPFALLAVPLADQGFVLEGSARTGITVTGTATAPLIEGSLTTSGARLIDVKRNLAINDIAGTVTFNRDRAMISSLSGNLSPGGRIALQGSVGIGGDFAADLRLALNEATYVDGNLLTATVNGDLTLKGPLLAGPVLGGRLTVLRANITVPSSLPASLAQLNVEHVHAPADVRALLESISPKDTNGTDAGIGLDLTLVARSNIFVRGRGIDAELGGSLTIAGTAAQPNVSGAFEMRRGRIVILTRRLDFSTGKITFGGSLIPVLDLSASNTVDQTTVTVSVSGPANDPQIGFSSAPALPEDEVLARLIFGQSLSRLSPLQIAQLADAVTQLAGGSSSSLLQTLRSSLGVDDLDINTDASGQTTVSVGRYLNNRTYFQLEQGGSGGGARASINLDVGRGVKLKGSAGSEGGSAGIFYEREY